MANGLFRRDGFSRTEAQHNAKADFREDGQLWIQATKNIAKDSEIFVFYGEQYRLDDNHETRRINGYDTRPC